MKTSFKKRNTPTSILQRFQMIVIIIVALQLAITQKAFSQNCYAPISGSNIVAGVIDNTGLCITQLCIGSQTTAIQALTNSNAEDYIEFNSFVSLLNVSGVGIRNSTANFNYPANSVVGFKIGVGTNSVLDVNLFGNYYIATFKDGSNTPEETFSAWSLLQSSALLPGEKIAYLTAKTTKEFDEVRFYTTNVAAIQANLKVYHAFTFSGTCNMENNTFCEDFIQGPHVRTMYNGSLLTVAGSLVNPANISNGYKLDYAVLKTPANLVGNVFVSVLDLNNTYPGGHRAGFIIEPESSSEILDATALGALTISTYLYGTLQESQIVYNNSNNSFIDLNLFSTQGGGKIKVGFVTNATKPFNEVRLTVSSLVNANLNSGLRIYGAFEEPASCGECQRNFNTTTYTNAVIKSSSGIATITNVASNVINPNANSYAAQALLATVSTIRVGTNNNQVMNAGDYAGFEVSDGTSLLKLGLFTGLKVRTYLNNSLVEEVSSSGLVGVSLISSNSRTLVGFKTNFPFDAWELYVDNGITINLGSGWRFYNAILIKDTDNDGIPDCMDYSNTCNDAYDTDGNGIPDGCDQADIDAKIELITNVSKFRSGDTLQYKITVKNNGPQSASGVQVRNIAPSQTENLSWTASFTGTGLVLPATSGQGSIEHVFAQFPNAVQLEYIVNVKVNTTYNLPDLKNSITVTSNTQDPSPNCPACVTSGLIRENHPDLRTTATVLSSSFTFPNNLTKSIALNLQELNGTATDSTITIVIPKSITFSIVFNTNTNSFSGNPMDNANWTLTSDANNYYIRSNAAVSVSANGIKSIVIVCTYNTNNTLPEFSRFNYYLAPNSGRERNASNNSQNIDFKLN